MAPNAKTDKLIVFVIYLRNKLRYRNTVSFSEPTFVIYGGTWVACTSGKT